MTFNVNDMHAQLVGGGARPTLFEVNLTDTNTNLKLNLTKSRFMVHAASLPESNIGFFELPYFGRKVQYAGDRTFQPWRVSIFNDEDFAIKFGLESWMEKIQSTVPNVRSAEAGINGSGYKGQATVTQFGKAGNVIRQYQFVGLFPVTIDPIRLDWNATDTIQSFDVTFRYDYWLDLGGNAAPNTGRN